MVTHNVGPGPTIPWTSLDPLRLYANSHPFRSRRSHGDSQGLGGEGGVRGLRGVPGGACGQDHWGQPTHGPISCWRQFEHRFGTGTSTMMTRDDLWWSTMIHDDIWWCMRIYDDLWWFIMIHDDLWRYMMIYDYPWRSINDSWWPMMIYDDLWYFACFTYFNDFRRRFCCHISYWLDFRFIQTQCCVSSSGFSVEVLLLPICSWGSRDWVQDQTGRPDRATDLHPGRLKWVWGCVHKLP